MLGCLAAATVVTLEPIIQVMCLTYIESSCRYRLKYVGIVGHNAK